MNKFYFFVLALLIIFVNDLKAQHNPYIKQYKKMLILNATAHIGNGEVINKSAVGIVDGKITLVKNALSYDIDKAQWDTIVDAYGQHLYPGFIAANTTLGLVDIDAVRATRDFDETGAYNSNVRSLIAFNTDSQIIPTVRTNGVLLCQTTPRGGRVSGTSSLMHLNGWNWEDAVVKKDDGIHVNWPRMYYQTGWWASSGGNVKINDKYKKQRRELIDFIKKAQAYVSSKKEKKDLRMEAMRGIFKGEKRLYIHTDQAREIEDALLMLDEVDIAYPVIVGGYESWKVATHLKEKNVPVMLSRIHQLPSYEDEDVELPYRLPAILREKGVEYCIQNEGDMDAMQTRNLPFQAGTARAYGLTEEEAVAAISLNVAKIIGVDDRMGSIEVGKEAHLFLSEGDALEIKSNQVNMILINGNIVEITNSQWALYQKYKQKYKNEGKLD